MIEMIKSYRVRDLKWLDVVKIIAMYFGYGIIGTLVFELFGYSTSFENKNVIVEIMYSFVTMVVPVLMIMKKFRYEGESEKVDKIKLEVKDFILFLLIECVMLLIVSGLALFMSEETEVIQNTNIIVDVFISCIFAPIGEELFVKAILLAGLLKKYGAKKAILISSLVFAIFHINPVTIIFTFISGVVTGYVYYRTRRLIVVIMMHSFWNALLTIMNEIIIYYPENGFLSILTSIAYFSLGFLLLYYILKKLNLKQRYLSINED